MGEDGSGANKRKELEPNKVKMTTLVYRGFAYDCDAVALAAVPVAEGQTRVYRRVVTVR